MDIQTVIVFPVLKDLVTISGPTLVGAGVYWINHHVKAGRWALAKDLLAKGVTFAEQMAKQMGWNNAQKKEEAIKAAKAWAAGIGLKFSDDEWAQLGEAILGDLKQIWNQAQGEPEKPAAAPAKA